MSRYCACYSGIGGSCSCEGYTYDGYTWDVASCASDGRCASFTRDSGNHPKNVDVAGNTALCDPYLAQDDQVQNTPENVLKGIYDNLNTGDLIKENTINDLWNKMDEIFTNRKNVEQSKDKPSSFNLIKKTDLEDLKTVIYNGYNPATTTNNQYINGTGTPPSPISNLVNTALLQIDTGSVNPTPRSVINKDHFKLLASWLIAVNHACVCVNNIEYECCPCNVVCNCNY